MPFGKITKKQVKAVNKATKLAYKRKYAGMPARVSNSKSSITLNMTGFANIQNSTAFAAAAAVNFPLNAPTYYVSSSTAWGQIASLTAQWTALAGLFDEYQVQSMRITFMPQFVNNQTLATGGSGYNSIMYTVWDRDDAALLASEATALVEGNFPKSYTTGRNMSRTIKQSQNKGIWFNLQTVSTAPATATTSGSILSPTYYETLKLYFPLIEPTAVVGRIYVDWVVKFRAVKI